MFASCSGGKFLESLRHRQRLGLRLFHLIAPFYDVDDEGTLRLISFRRLHGANVYIKVTAIISCKHALPPEIGKSSPDADSKADRFRKRRKIRSEGPWSRTRAVLILICAKYKTLSIFKKEY